jgi:polyisoprenoid-binding protein YceI
MRIRLVLLWVGLATALIPAQSILALDLQLDRNAAHNVTFISDAPVEDIEGVTSAIDGYVSWTGDSLASGTRYDSSEFYFEVELNGLETGIGLRDRHMRENYLETEKFPYASFSGSIAGVEVAGDTSLVRIAGTFLLHGEEQAMTLVCKVRPDEMSYHVTTQFEIRLPDFKIEVPSLMFLKISEVIAVKIDFYLKPME